MQSKLGSGMAFQLPADITSHDNITMEELHEKKKKKTKK